MAGEGYRFKIEGDVSSMIPDQRETVRRRVAEVLAPYGLEIDLIPFDKDHEYPDDIYRPTTRLELEGKAVEVATLNKLILYAMNFHYPKPHPTSLGKLEQTWQNIIQKKRGSTEVDPDNHDSRFPRYDGEEKEVVYLGSRDDNSGVEYPNWGLTQDVFIEFVSKILEDPKGYSVANLGPNGTKVRGIFAGFLAFMDQYGRPQTD